MVAVFSDVTSCSLAEVYQSIGGTCHRHIQFSSTVKMEVVGSSETVVTTRLYAGISNKIVVLILTTVRTSYLIYTSNTYGWLSIQGPSDRRWFLTAKPGIQIRVTSCEIHSGSNDTEIDSSPSSLGLLLSITIAPLLHTNILPHSLRCGMTLIKQYTIASVFNLGTSYLPRHLAD
jgi:hypothetical protein